MEELSIIQGHIRDIIYKPQLIPTKISGYDFATFDINTAKGSGIIHLGSDTNTLAYSKWTSPKRSRTFPFVRIYDTFHLNSKHVTIIPIIKDEGADTKNNDRINYITFSWMNLLNVYIILAWYEDGKRKSGDKNLITGQRLNNDHVKEQLEALSGYHLSAMHWNETHFEKDFERIYLNAVESYQRISQEKNVKLHPISDHIKTLKEYSSEKGFDLEAFKVASLLRSHSAAKRETVTSHFFEQLGEGNKHLLEITNNLKGQYYLSPDRVYIEDGILVIEECKNTTSKTHKLPTMLSVKDGLFKNILYINLNELKLNGISVPFRSQLKLTGGFTGDLSFPVTNKRIENFIFNNKFSRSEIALLASLNQEAVANPGLNIQLSGNE